MAESKRTAASFKGGVLTADTLTLFLGAIPFLRAHTHSPHKGAGRRRILLLNVCGTGVHTCMPSLAPLLLCFLLSLVSAPPRSHAWAFDPCFSPRHPSVALCC